MANQNVDSFKSRFFDSSNLNFTTLFNQNKQQYCCKRPREEKMPKNQRPSRQEQQRLRAVDLVRAHLILYFSSILRAPSARPGHQEEADERGWPQKWFLGVATTNCSPQSSLMTSRPWTRRGWSQYPAILGARGPNSLRAAFVALDATAFDFSAFFLHKAFYNNMCVCFA